MNSSPVFIAERVVVAVKNINYRPRIQLGRVPLKENTAMNKANSVRKAGRQGAKSAKIAFF
ncbi:hypothetical protein CO701_11680 [Citrobacter werkmanii]|nr:hypothetical protein CO701_11680 [Citrobacter werkmanii]